MSTAYEVFLFVMTVFKITFILVPLKQSEGLEYTRLLQIKLELIIITLILTSVDPK